MRSLVVSLIIGAAIIWGSVAYTARLESLSKEMLAVNSQIMDYIEHEEWDKADAKIQYLYKFVNERRMAMEATGDHEVLDKIEMNISELIAYNDAEMKADAMAKCQMLDFLIAHLPKNFKLKIENIL